MKFPSLPVYGMLLSLILATGCTPASQNTNSQTGSAPSPQTAAPADAGEINLYSSRHYDTDAELYQQFSQKTGIKVNLIEGSDDELLERLKNEGKNSPADVLITVDVARLWRSQQDGLLQPTTSTVLTSAIPAHLRSSNNTWFGLTKRARIIVYNTDKVKPTDLSTYEDLANPKWKGKFCVRSSNNTYNQSLVASEIVKNGEPATEKWVKGLVSNFARQPEGNDTDQIQAVASGQCDVALVNSYYFARMRASADPKDQDIIGKVGAFFPNQSEGGTHINISGAGIVANAPHAKQAKEFLEYMVTPAAQEIFANNNNEYPVIANLAPNKVVAQFGEWKASDLPLEGFGEKNADAVKLMDRAGWK